LFKKWSDLRKEDSIVLFENAGNRRWKMIEKLD
jgi:hypothetical protein